MNNNNPKELNEKQLKQTVGGEGEKTFKYSFRVGDYIFLSGVSMFQIKVDVDTNDDNYHVFGTVKTSGFGNHDGTYTTFDLMQDYKYNGGYLQAME